MILYTEQFVEVKFQHLFAAIFYGGNKGRFGRIKGQDNIRFLLHQQGFQAFFMKMPFPQERPDSLENVFERNFDVVDVEVNETDSFRDGIEGGAASLVGRYNGNVISAFFSEETDLVEHNPFHPAGIIDGMYAIDQFHLKRP
jgi:hypothetical protein